MITVIGSINMDIVVQTNIFPKQGETVLGELFTTIPGGKGANQAIAASRLGSNVQMIGAVGQDSFGTELYENLINENINVIGITKTKNTTGIANILLHENDNRIIVVPGANFDVSKEMVDANLEMIKQSKLVMLQLEIPVETIEYVLSLCEDYQVPVLLNPAPAGNFKKEWIEKVTYLTPNETECEEIFGANFETVLSQYPNKIIVTLGSEGAAYSDGKNIVRVPGFKTTAVDTTGAGDTFNGALAYAICSGINLKDSVRFANIAASISVEKFGAQGGMPNLEAVKMRLGGN
ncbi:ribokinase [Lysinibacillus composti]|uniref:Ribokinase n=1 Tax=Lysinibacillus composti TaxID=720633 RepID=A0A3N9UIJ4_9BACI|nr:ribokinase [Lysinibacillus composti]MBM7607607.1 ribokinase [Lysinibacillus composti]RQW75889.1 ribokinase [Lysinibacillus composti]